MTNKANLSEESFLQELLAAIPEFKKIHEGAKEFHDIGIHLVFADFRLLAENAVKEKNEKLLKRIVDFVIRCEESEGKIHDAVFVSFFENMDKEGLEYFLDHLPKEFSEIVQAFLIALDYRPSSN